MKRYTCSPNVNCEDGYVVFRVDDIQGRQTRMAIHWVTLQRYVIGIDDEVAL